LLSPHSLKNLLSDSGAMGLMIYEKYVRIGDYQMQQLMRMITANEEYLSNKVTNTKRILANLLETHWFFP
jgi:hypothetical protein